MGIAHFKYRIPTIVWKSYKDCGADLMFRRDNTIEMIYRRFPETLEFQCPPPFRTIQLHFSPSIPSLPTDYQLLKCFNAMIAAANNRLNSGELK